LLDSATKMVAMCALGELVLAARTFVTWISEKLLSTLSDSALSGMWGVCPISWEFLSENCVALACVLAAAVVVLGGIHLIFKSRQEHEKEMKRMEVEKELEIARIQSRTEVKSKRAIVQERHKADNKRRKIELDNSRHQRETEKLESEMPRREMIEYAERVSSHNVDTMILQTLEAKGFKSFLDAVVIKAKSSDVMDAAMSVLRDTPHEIRKDIAMQLQHCSEMRGVKDIFTFNNGHGVQAKVLVKSKEVGDSKSIALLAYGMSFECKKVVDHFKTLITTVPHPIYEDQAKSVLESKGWFTDTYRTEKVRKLIRTEVETKKEQIPVFKQDVLDIKMLTLVNEALEFEASKKALAVMT